MPRDFRQDISGYKVAIRHFEKEYKRALGNTTRSKELYQRTLDDIERLLSLYRREQRELAAEARKSIKKKPLMNRARGEAA